jgi:hypothetical protein
MAGGDMVLEAQSLGETQSLRGHASWSSQNSLLG